MRKSNPPTIPLSLKSPVAAKTTDNVTKDAMILHDTAFAKLLILLAMKVFTPDSYKSGGEMATWFSKYGFPIEAVYLITPKGGATISGCASVQICKEAKNLFLTNRKDDVLNQPVRMIQSPVDYSFKTLV